MRDNIPQIATPISHQFENETFGKEIAANSDCLEVRERSLDSELAYQHLFHIDIDLTHKWDADLKSYLHDALNKKPDLILVDGNQVPETNKIKIKSIVKGDETIPSISAASIIAKVARDKHIKNLSKKFKKYSWDTNFGYGTKKHQEALKKFGVTC